MTNQVNSVLRIADNAFIPINKQNSDYIAYLAWVEQGGKVLLADEGVA